MLLLVEGGSARNVIHLHVMIGKLVAQLLGHLDELKISMSGDLSKAC